MGFWKKAAAGYIGYKATESLIHKAKETEEERNRKTYAGRVVEHGFSVSVKTKQENIYKMLKEIIGSKGGKIKIEEEPEEMSFKLKKSLLGSKTIVNASIKKLGNGFYVNLSYKKGLLSGYSIIEMNEAKQELVNIGEDLKNLVK